MFPAAPFGTSDALPTKRVTETLAVPRGAIKVGSAAAGRMPAFTIRTNDGDLPSEASLVSIDFGS